MKKILHFLSIAPSLLLSSFCVFSCSSLGIASKGADYFVGKQESDLVKYFKYDGEAVSANGEFDKAVYFSNKETTVYMDKTTVQKFKNRRYNSVSDFSFNELSDGCRLVGNDHAGICSIANRPWKRYDEDVPSGGTPLQDVLNELAAGKNYSILLHRNNNTEINSKIKSFNNLIQTYGAVKKSSDDSIFNKTAIGSEYYIYDIESTTGNWDDQLLGNSTYTQYKYLIYKVSVFEDSKSVTDTKTAYIRNYQKKSYSDSDNKEITEKQALANKASLVSSGYTEREKTKGISLIAYIKDGVVVQAEETDK